jgi:hypothetical protein
VLKQAAGRVRCGGCGCAFNALEYLSETKPDNRPGKATEERIPELKPDPMDSEGGQPKSISAAQSAALLKTLDELAGSDIRIEDTGVEWRVLDEDEIGDAAGDSRAFDLNVEDQPKIDEILEDSPTPVDQFLTNAPPQIDAPEIFAEAAEEPASPSVDELRFDDNTPLPDDFDFDIPPRAPADEAEPASEPAAAAEDNMQVDLDLTEPDDWTDILDEFAGIAADLTIPESASGADSEDSAAVDDELAPPAEEYPAESYDGDEILDVDSQFAIQAEALGIELSGTHRTLDAVEEEEPEAPDGPATQEDIGHEASQDAADSGDGPVENAIDDEFVDEIGKQLADIADESDLVEETARSSQLDLIDEESADDEPVVEERSGEEPVGKELADDEAADDEAVDKQPADEETPGEKTADDQPADDEVADDEAVDEEPADDEVADEEPANEETPGEKTADDQPEGDEAADDEAVDEHHVPPLTEEEQTINMQIDQELLAIAVEDENGFASTMILPEDSTAPKAADDVDADEKTGDKKRSSFEDTGTGFETIIMEGEFVRSALDPEKLAADTAAAANLAGAAAAERDAERASGERKTSFGTVAGVVIFLVLLAAQVVHQNRNTLATFPAFNDVAGPVYRAIGKPLSPAWDVTGWRFEASTGNADEANADLTIYSRVANTSEQALPYPLIGVSLTDRFEETIGSRILDPAEYLSNDLDPRKLVQPGSTFNAVITIQSPAGDATGFKLDVCYRETGGKLRCAIDDFK